MEIRIGQIVKVKHSDDNFKNYIHPFVIVNITKKNIFGVQCTSEKIDGTSYFTENNIPYFKLIYSDIEYVTHVRLDQFRIIDSENVREVVCQLNRVEYRAVSNELLNQVWENNKTLSCEAVWNHIEMGVQNFGALWKLNI